MNPYPKKYWKAYDREKSKLDPRIQDWTTTKEELIAASPLANPLLKNFNGIRRYKTGKLRILYCLSTERPDLWNPEPAEPEILFLYVSLRDEKIYKDARKYLESEGLI